MTVQELLQQIKSLLREHYGNRLKELILYGSEARGDATPDSDIDILCVLEGPVKDWKEIRAIIDAGALKCWGSNRLGQLGDGTTTDSIVPIDVSGLSTGVTVVSVSYDHTCALTTTGGLKCWGENSYCQLGDGTNKTKKTPVDVTGLTSGAISIKTGYRHTCALTSGGGVKCWGYNHYGELGDGTQDVRAIPVDVVGLSSGVVAISSGYCHTCALMLEGSVKYWGNNSIGQLGDGTTTDSSTPVDVLF